LDFEIVSPIVDIESIAAGASVRDRRRLRRVFGGRRWRKMKGVALVRELDGVTYQAELHWYEAVGVGRREFKIKRRRE